jgi:hypothetical protein
MGHSPGSSPCSSLERHPFSILSESV